MLGKTLPFALVGIVDMLLITVGALVIFHIPFRGNFLLLMFCAGFGMMRQVVAGDTILQAIVDDGKRGRVMSFYTVAVFGFFPSAA